MVSLKNPVSTKRRGSTLSRRPARRPLLEGLERRELLTTYDVGQGLAYTTIGSVPWTKLGPGDTVNIHWQTQAYHEKILISNSGTAAAPIRVIGIPGPSGQQPVIDGQNATTNSQFHYIYDPQQANALVLIERSSDQAYGTLPSYIDIEGLDLRNAYYTNTFTDSHGATQSYAEFAASLYIEGADNITLHNNTLDNSGLGLFILSNGDEAHTVRNVMVDGNHIYGNGVPNQYLEHNVYSEAVGITYQYNNFGPLRAGAQGSNLKDRSAGTVIRYNYFAPGGHILDLVDPEDSNIVATDPSFTNTNVYGNILDNTGNNTSSLLIHFGGDSGNTAIYRPHLNFYDNTIVNTVDQSNQWRTILFEVDTNSQTLDVRNNIIYNNSATPGATPTNFELMDTDGVATFGANWVSNNWLPSLDTAAFNGSISGTGNFYIDPNNQPGFVNLSGGDYHLAAGSSAIGRGGALGSGWTSVTQQYVAPTSGKARSNILDFGAYQAGAVVVIPTVTSETPALSATNVAAPTSLTATFNESVVGSSIAFVLKDSSGTAVATAAPSYNDLNHTVTLVPSATLKASTVYTATISGVKDAAGNTIASPFSWSFTTATPVIPTVTSETPAPSAVNVASTTAVATYNEAVLASPVAFTLTDPSGAAVTATVSYNSTSHAFILQPSASLKGSSKYTAAISGVKDAAGNVQASPFTWSFTTATPVIPTVTGETPAPSAINVAPTMALTATFNESVVASSIAFVLKDPSGTLVATAAPYYNDTNHTVTLQPSAALKNTTVYTATISGVKDAAGNTIAAPFTWSFTTDAPASIPGLVASYNFDEGTGTVLHDLSGNGNNGTLSNATWTTAGKYGGALSFNGTLGSWVTVNDSASLHLTTGMTLEAWVDPSTLSSPDQGWVAAISKEHQNSSNDISYSLYGATGTGTSPAGHVLVGTYDYGTTAGATLTTNHWTFITATYDGCTLNTYVNGSLIDSTYTGGGSIFTTSDPLRIGGDWSGEMFTGLIDNVRIYNTPLSQSQIASDMNTALSSSASATPAATVKLTAVSATTIAQPTTLVAAVAIPTTTASTNSWSASLPADSQVVIGHSPKPTSHHPRHFGGPALASTSALRFARGRFQAFSLGSQEKTGV